MGAESDKRCGEGFDVNFEGRLSQTMLLQPALDCIAAPKAVCFKQESLRPGSVPRSSLGHEFAT
jgi:hypothetical protein